MSFKAGMADKAKLDDEVSSQMQKAIPKDVKQERSNADADVESFGSSGVYSDPWSKKLFRLGVETRGVQPVPEEQRTDTQFSKIFFIWFSWNFNILTFSAGTLGPAAFGLGLRDSCLTILFFNLICCIPAAYICTWGPKLGMRTMIISRYSFGYYGVIPICILNLATMIGFTILNCILGGQALASVTYDISWTVGIVIISVLSLGLSFCGYEKLAWIPTAITYLVIIGVGAKHFTSAPPPEALNAAALIPVSPVTAPSILSFASTLAGFAITFSGLATDFSIYYRSDVETWRIFAYSYIGLLVPIVTLQSLGAAAVISATAVPSWQEGYMYGNVGGLLEAMLHPTKGFGKFLTVLLSLSVAGNIASTYYSVSIAVQVFMPCLVIIPRYMLSVVVFALVVPISVVGAHHFYEALVNFLGLIGYWAGSFIGIVVVEHLWFRRKAGSRVSESTTALSELNSPLPTPMGATASFGSANIETSAPPPLPDAQPSIPLARLQAPLASSYNYDLAAWDTPSQLPSGLAAIGAVVCSVGLIVPSMHQAWYLGPIAESTGDIGFEVAFAVSVLVYVPFRILEKRLQGRL